jgi:hypothetical protein
MKLSPIAIFAFNRPDHLRELINSLKQNPEFCNSDLYIFIDGPRNETEKAQIEKVKDVVASEIEHLNCEVNLQTTNRGLSRSLLSGIDHIFEKHDRIIVLEDDLIVSPHFLDFCNRGLNIYESNNQVGSIQGFTYDIHANVGETYFLLGADCWGWGTWKDRWSMLERDSSHLYSELVQRRLSKKFDLDGAYPYSNMLKRQAHGELDSWAIRWHASMFLQGKVSLYPSTSLVENCGQDGTGTHIGSTNFVPRRLQNHRPKIEREVAAETHKARVNLKRILRRKYGTYPLWSPMKYYRFLMRRFTL